MSLVDGQTPRMAANGRSDAPRSTPYKLGRPSRVVQGQVRRLELSHESFRRWMGVRLTTQLRTPASLELLGTDETSLSEHVATMPSPTVVAEVALEPLPGLAIIEMATPTALRLVDRLLGGAGALNAVRRPTELEMMLLEDVFAIATEGLEQAMSHVEGVTAELRSLERVARLVSVGIPTTMALVMSYAVVIGSASERSEGLLTVAYPSQLVDSAFGISSDASVLWRTE